MSSSSSFSGDSYKINNGYDFLSNINSYEMSVESTENAKSSTDEAFSRISQERFSSEASHAAQNSFFSSASVVPSTPRKQSFSQASHVTQQIFSTSVSTPRAPMKTSRQLCFDEVNHSNEQGSEPSKKLSFSTRTPEMVLETPKRTCRARLTFGDLEEEKSPSLKPEFKKPENNKRLSDSSSVSFSSKRPKLAIWPQLKLLSEHSEALPENVQVQKNNDSRETSFLFNTDNQVAYALKPLGEGKQHRVWEIVQIFEGARPITAAKCVIKTFHPQYVRPKDKPSVSNCIMKGYEQLKKYDLLRVPMLLNEDTYKSDGYFIWERIEGTKAELNDVKEIIKAMLLNFDSLFIEDFRPDNVIKTTYGTLYDIDPSWNGGAHKEHEGALELEIVTLLEAWVCPYNAPKVSTTDYEAFMNELEELKKPEDIQEIWGNIKARVNESFHLVPVANEQLEKSEIVPVDIQTTA